MVHYEKTITFLLAIVCLLGVLRLPVAADVDRPDEKVGVDVFYVKKGVLSSALSNSLMPRSGVSLQAVDLSDDIISIDWTLDMRKSNTTGTCKTNTTKIYIPFDLDKTGSVKIEVLNSTGTSLAETTVKFDIVDESSPVVKFTNLTSSNTYKVRITNINYFKVRFLGAVKERLYF